MQFNPLRPLFNRNALAVKWPSGMTYHLPLTTDLSPLVGSGGAATITRATSKRQQNSANTFAVHGNNELLPTTNMFGIEANGLCTERAVTNDVTNSDDMTIAGAWAASNCTVSAKNVTDPGNVVNEAQTLTPTSNAGYIQNTTAAACASKNVFGCVWLRRAAGAAGSHTGQLVITDSNAAVVATKDITITAAWQLFYHEYVGIAGSGTAILRIVPDKTGTTAVDARMPFIEVYANTNIATLVTPCLTTRNQDVAAQDCSADIRGDVGSLYVEVVPLHKPADGLNHGIYLIDPLYVVGSKMSITKAPLNNLRFYYDTGAGSAFAQVAATDSNFARGVKHKIAITWENGSLQLYLDGALVASNATVVVGAAALNAAARLYVGGLTVGGESIISNYRYWPKVLTAPELERITR